MMKKLFLLFIPLVFTACQSDQNIPKQTYICQNLIEGYLKAQNQPDYQLSQRQDSNDAIRYVYQQSQHNGAGSKLIPSQLEFTCRQQKHTITLQRISQTGQPISLFVVYLSRQPVVHFPDQPYIQFRDRH